MMGPRDLARATPEAVPSRLKPLRCFTQNHPRASSGKKDNDTGTETCLEQPRSRVEFNSLLYRGPVLQGEEGD